MTINGKACADYALTRRFSVVYSLRDYDLGVVNDGKAVERVTTWKLPNAGETSSKRDGVRCGTEPRVKTLDPTPCRAEKR